MNDCDCGRYPLRKCARHPVRSAARCACQYPERHYGSSQCVRSEALDGVAAMGPEGYCWGCWSAGHDKPSPLRAHAFTIEHSYEFCGTCGGTRLAVFGSIGDRRTSANAVHPAESVAALSPFVRRALASELPGKAVS